MDFDRLTQPAGRVVRTVAAVAAGTVAVGTQNNPGYVSELVASYEEHIGVNALLGEQMGNFAASHPNPTVAFFGIAAVQLALSRGRILPTRATVNNVGKRIGSTLSPSNLSSRLNHTATTKQPVRELGEPMGEALPEDLGNQATGRLGGALDRISDLSLFKGKPAPENPSQP